jgi:UDP-glucose 4-epimerase
LAAECAGVDRSVLTFEYTGGDRGWKGDVPIVRLNANRIRSLGWVCRSGSREALRDSMTAMLDDLKAGRV